MPTVTQISGASADNGLTESTIEEQWRVVMDAATDLAPAVLVATGLPRVGNQHPTATNLRVESVNPQQDPDHPRVWVVRVRYANNVGSLDPPNDNPLLRPSQVSYDYIESEEPIYTDINGNAIASSAREPFDPPPTIDVLDPVVVIERNEADFNFAQAFDYTGAVNTDTFFGAAAGKALMHKITATSGFENNIAFWRVRYEIRFRDDGWAKKILDHGYLALSGGKQVRIKDDNGRDKPVTTYLNGSGVAATTPTFLSFTVRKQRNFAPLNLP